MLHKYDMGFTVDGTPIPDPSKMSYEVADLDTEATRDTRGYLHRKMVATKINFALQWNALDKATLAVILQAVNKPGFTFVAPDPRTVENLTWTSTYYVGNREGECLYYLLERDEPSIYTLSLKFIQY